MHVIYIKHAYLTLSQYIRHYDKAKTILIQSQYANAYDIPCSWVVIITLTHAS